MTNGSCPFQETRNAVRFRSGPATVTGDAGSGVRKRPRRWKHPHASASRGGEKARFRPEDPEARRPTAGRRNASPPRGSGANAFRLSIYHRPPSELGSLFREGAEPAGVRGMARPQPRLRSGGRCKEGER
jgi:hypothetical protein